MGKIKMLGVAPYAELEPLMTEVAKNFTEVELFTFTGFYENAVYFSKAFPNKEFDVVVTRGGTASLLSSLIDTPVVDVGVSTLDLLRVMQQAIQCSQNAAVVSYPYIIAQVKTLAEFLRLNIKTYAFDTPAQIGAVVEQCCKDGIDLIVGGAATKEPTITRGAQFVMITSSRECVENGFRQAIELCRRSSGVQEHNRLFQSMLDRSASAIFLFGEDQEIRFTNVVARQMLNNVEKLELYLIGSIPRLSSAGKLRQLKKFNNDLYEVNGKILQLTEERFFQFELHLHAALYKPSSFLELEGDVDLSLHQQVGGNEIYLRPLMKTIQTAAQSALPVLIQGEIGLHKELIARYLHSKSDAQDTMFLCLHCGEVTEKGWEQLMNYSASPLHATGYSVYFENADALPEHLQMRIASYIEDTRMAKRHRLISSSCRDLSEDVAAGRFCKQLYLQLTGYTVNVPPLEQRKQDLPGLIHLLVPQYNTELAKSVVGFEPEALRLMTDYSWPMNLVQLEKVVRQLVATASTLYISAGEVAAVLHHEMRKRVTPMPPMNLTGTLDEIEVRVINWVLREENMNQSAAAKRLGIGRSTLWRKISSAGQG